MVAEIDIASDAPLVNANGSNYKIFKRIDQAKVFGNVLDVFTKRGAVGIFPEGGSHDRTDILPLKAGVAIIAY